MNGFKLLKTSAAVLLASGLSVACVTGVADAKGGSTTTTTASATSTKPAPLPADVLLPTGKITSTNTNGVVWVLNMTVDQPFSQFIDGSLAYTWDANTVALYKANGYTVVSDSPSFGQVIFSNGKYQVQIAARGRDAHSTDLAVWVSQL